MTIMDKFFFPTILLVFCAVIGFFIWSGRIPAEDHAEMISGIVFLFLVAVFYLVSRYREERKK